MIPDFNYAPFVWSSYLIAALVIAWQMVQPWLKHRQVQNELREDLVAQQLEQPHDPKT
jgi:heme exporter protein CcmD